MCVGYFRSEKGVRCMVQVIDSQGDLTDVFSEYFILLNGIAFILAEVRSSRKMFVSSSDFKKLDQSIHTQKKPIYKQKHFSIVPSRVRWFLENTYEYLHHTVV